MNYGSDWRVRNKLLDELINDEHIVRFIKSRRLTWLGHVKRCLRKSDALENIGWRNIWNKEMNKTKEEIDPKC